MVHRLNISLLISRPPQSPQYFYAGIAAGDPVVPPELSIALSMRTLSRAEGAPEEKPAGNLVSDDDAATPTPPAGSGTLEPQEMKLRAGSEQGQGGDVPLVSLWLRERG